MQPAYLHTGVYRSVLIGFGPYCIGRTVYLRITVVLIPDTYQYHSIAVLVSEFGERLVVAHSDTGSRGQTVNIYRAGIVHEIEVTVIACSKIGNSSHQMIELIVTRLSSQEFFNCNYQSHSLPPADLFRQMFDFRHLQKL